MAVRIFRHYIPQLLIVLGLVEFFVLVLAAYAGTMFEFAEFSPAEKLMSNSLPATVTGFAASLFLAMVATGLYQRGLRDSKLGLSMRVLFSFGLGLLLFSVMMVIYPRIRINPTMATVMLVAALLGIGFVRYLFYMIADNHLLKQRVMVLGAGREAEAIHRLRRKSDLQGIDLVGYLCFQKDRAIVTPDKLMTLETTIPDLVRKNNIDELVIAMDYRNQAFPIGELLECKMSGVHVTDLLTFMERQTGKISLDILRPTNIVFLEGFSHAVLKSYTKRIFDIIVCVGLLVATLPIMALTALAIFVESGFSGPIFYLQERVGRNGRPFNVYKFRSMRVDAEKDGVAQWAGKKDARITRTGAFIRKSRIDELPQLINVLRGNMSFVGPRPERPQFVTELAKQIPYYGIRHRVNPGITGWAQICYPYGASVQDSKEKLQYDLYYIKNYSIFLDLTIMIQTAQVIIWGKGR